MLARIVRHFQGRDDSLCDTLENNSAAIKRAMGLVVTWVAASTIKSYFYYTIAFFSPGLPHLSNELFVRFDPLENSLIDTALNKLAAESTSKNELILNVTDSGKETRSLFLKSICFSFCSAASFLNLFSNRFAFSSSETNVEDDTFDEEKFEDELKLLFKGPFWWYANWQVHFSILFVRISYAYHRFGRIHLRLHSAALA